MTHILTLAIVLSVSSTEVAAGQDQDTATISAFIARQAQRERGEEYPDARKVVSGDLNHDTIADTTVLYTIEGQGGSNNYIQYLAVFVRSHTRLVPQAYAEVGGKGYRAIELPAVQDNGIDLTILDYAPGDASCCPSKKGTTRYVLVGRQLKERRRSPAH